MKIKSLTLWFLFLCFATLTSLTANADGICPPELDAVPVQSGGRVKPYLVHADEVIKFLTGKTSVVFPKGSNQKISAAEIKQSPTNSFYDLITNMQTIRRIYLTIRKIVPLLYALTSGLYMHCKDAGPLLKSPSCATIIS